MRASSIARRKGTRKHTAIELSLSFALRLSVIDVCYIYMYIYFRRSTNFHACFIDANQSCNPFVLVDFARGLATPQIDYTPFARIVVWFWHSFVRDGRKKRTRPLLSDVRAQGRGDARESSIYPCFARVVTLNGIFY